MSFNRIGRVYNLIYEVKYIYDIANDTEYDCTDKEGFA